MSEAERYQVASADLVYDTIEGEVIILDIQTGTYFQLVGNAAPVWNWLVEGSSIDEINARLAQQYAIETFAVARGVHQFVLELKEEKLLQPRTGDVPPAPSDSTLPAVFDKTFVPPALLKYTDMQSLLLLDPIHDVDSPGWPITSARNPA